METNQQHNECIDNNVNTLLSSDIPYKLGKYEIKNELGRGGCGIVYRGHDPFIKRDVAIKVGWSDAETQKQASLLAQMDFFSEAHAVGKLQHPNIVALYDAQVEKDLSYIVMEFVEGETLSKYCGKKGVSISDEKILEIIIKCCMALHFTHEMGVIHRDIKPSNIMLTSQGETKVMDFSVANVSEKGPIDSENIIGSPNYMSPEQIQRKNIGSYSDLYSLAAVAYHLLAGETVFPSGSLKKTFDHILNTEPPTLSKVRPDLPQSLSIILFKALSKSPNDRYQSGKEFAAALSAIHEKLTHKERVLEFGNFSGILKNLKFFNKFELKDIEELLTIGNMLAYNKGEVIGDGVEMGSCYYLIVQGKAAIKKHRKFILVLNQDDCYGEDTNSPAAQESTSKIVAGTNVVVLKINTTQIESLPINTQLLFYKAFSQNLIYRLSRPKREQPKQLA